MGEWDWVFFFNEAQNNVESVTTYHQLDCDIGSLAEAHPEVIYFYAEFSPLKEWDFNEYAGQPTLFDTGVDRATIFILPDGEEQTLDFSKGIRITGLSLDAEPNAFGGTVELVDGDSRPPTPDDSEA